MSEWAFKRFWTEATAVQVEGGWRVELDSRPVKTPAKATLILPTQTMANALATEWNAVEKEVRPEQMPLTKLANSALDKVTVQHAEVANIIADYGGSDLLCYRASGPSALVERQAAAWDPFLHWAEQAHGISLISQTGVMPVAQPENSLAHIRAKTATLAPFTLTGFHELVAISGSWVIGYAALTREHAPEELWDIAILDELWQAEQWGDDDEALTVRTNKRNGFVLAAQFCNMCGS